jgi:DHA2 family multidrug resistance protein
MAGLMAKGYSALQAKQGALAILDATVMRQASMLSYNDAWMLILATFVLIAPAILILRRPKAHGPVEAGH